MGKWTSQSYETELISKLRQIIDDINQRKNKDGDTHYSFEEFVDNLDVKSKHARHYIEDLLRETCGSRRSRTEYYGSTATSSSSTSTSSSSARGHQWYPNRYFNITRSYLQQQQQQQQQGQQQQQQQQQTQTQDALNRASVNTDRITSDLTHQIQNLRSTVASTISSLNSIMPQASLLTASLINSGSTSSIPPPPPPATNSSSSSSATLTLSAVPQPSSSSSPSYTPDSPSILYTYPLHQDSEPSFIPVSPPLSSTHHVRYIPITSRRTPLGFSNVSLINSPSSSPPQQQMSHSPLPSSHLLSSPSNSIN